MPTVLYGRPPLHYVNTIRSLRLDLDYLESTCNAHIRSEDAVTSQWPVRVGVGRAGIHGKDYDPKKTASTREYT